MEDNTKIPEKWYHAVTVEDIGGLNRKIHVIYDSEGVEIAFNKAVDIVAKQVQLKGFRKGKAPKTVVKNFCNTQIKTTASTLLTNEGFLHACFEQKIQPLGKPRVEGAEFNVDGTFSCDIYVEVKPTILPSGYIGLQLNKPNINSVDIFNNILEGVRIQHSSVVEKDEVESGNMVEVDFEAKCGEDEVTAGKGHHFEIRSGMGPPFGDNLIGMKVGEIRESDYLVPDNFEKHAGEKALVKIVLNSISTKVLPTDEELAERMKVPSYEELIKLIQYQTEVETKNRTRQVLEESIVDKLLELHEFEVPEEWVKEEMSYVVKQFNVSIDNDESFKLYIRNMAERNVRRVFILDAIYDAEPHLNVKKEEIEELIIQEAERSGVSTLTIKNRLKKANVMDSVLGMLRQRKVMTFIIENAKIISEGESTPVENNEAIIEDKIKEEDNGNR